MPTVTTVVGAAPAVLGMADIRGRDPRDRPAQAGRLHPRSGLNILLVTEYARSTQGFAVEAVEEIVRLEWSRGVGRDQRQGRPVTSIAKLDAESDNPRPVRCWTWSRSCATCCRRASPTSIPPPWGPGFRCVPVPASSPPTIPPSRAA